MRPDWEALRARLLAQIDRAAAVALLDQRLMVASLRRSVGQRFRRIASGGKR